MSDRLCLGSTPREPDVNNAKGRRIRSRCAGAVVLGCLTVLAAMTSPASGSRISASYSLSPTLKLKTIRVTTGPQEIRVLHLAPGAVPDVQPAAQHFPLRKRTSAMSQAAGAIAGMNGDFGTNDGLPVHMLMIDGELWTTGLLPGNAVAWASDGSRAYVGAPDLRMNVVGSAGSLFPISTWNAPQSSSSVSGYTARGGTRVTPPGVTSPSSTDPKWCEARLEPTSGLAWAGSARTTITRRYKVTEQPEPCPRTPLDVGSTAGAVVVAAKYVRGTTNPVIGLSKGDHVRIKWRLAGWPGAVDLVGGGDQLVKKGANVAPHYYSGAPDILNNNPRTAIGITKGCSDVDLTTRCEMNWITVDGRQVSTNWSKGVRMPFVADELIHLGSWNAVNLDGGGSTTMWARDVNPAYCQIYPIVGGCLVERPASTAPGNERPVRQAEVVLPTADAGTPVGLR
jgi:Phosphodiester glycosidase